MTTSHQIPNAGILHTCLYHYCRFVVLDMSSVAYDQPDFHLVFIYYKYRTSQHTMGLVFNTRYKHGAIDRDNLTHVFTPPTKMLSLLFHTRYLYLTYDL